MKRRLGLFLGMLSSLIYINAHAADVCERSPTEIKAQFYDIQSRISFKNDGGLFDGGVCWWHSRFQRASIYLVKYAPEKQKPSAEQAKQLIRDIIAMNHVVEIPGYKDFFDFTLSFQNEIQEELNAWQLRDGFIFQQWVRGLYGRSSMPDDELKKRMDIVYSKFKENLPGLWVMAQLPGITSHALLIIDMKPRASGYDLTMIDSNAPDTNLTTSYHFGDRTVSSYGMVPYVGFDEDFKRIEKALKESCPSL